MAHTTTRVCPNCHSTLPVHFVRGRRIALVGASESGKTAFMTVLIHEFRYRVAERLGVSVSGADDETRRGFEGDYEHRLYGERRLFGPTYTTPAERHGYRRPMVFLIRGPIRSPLGNRARQTFLSFFDTAGEDMTTIERAEIYMRYLEAADGVILILDPLQTRGGRELAAKEARLPDPRPRDDPYSVLQNVTQMLQAGRPARRVRKPLAVVFTKLDAFWHEIPKDTALTRAEPSGPGCDEADSLDVHRHVQALLQGWDEQRMDQYLRLNYRRYRYFGVSALGASPTLDNRVSETGIRPYRVSDPILWLLSRLGTVPVIRRH